MQSVQAPDRRVEIVEGLFHDLRGDLGAHPAGLEVLVDDQQSPGLVDRLEDRLDVERRDRARVDHLDSICLRAPASPPPPASC